MPTHLGRLPDVTEYLGTQGNKCVAPPEKQSTCPGPAKEIPASLSFTITSSSQDLTTRKGPKPSRRFFFLRQPTPLLLHYAEASWLTPAVPWLSRHQPSDTQGSWGNERVRLTPNSCTSPAKVIAQLLHGIQMGLIGCSCKVHASQVPSEAAVSVACGLPRSQSSGAPPSKSTQFLLTCFSASDQPRECTKLSSAFIISKLLAVLGSGGKLVSG